MNDTHAHEHHPLATHIDPSVRRDRSLRQRTRPRRATAVGIEWVPPVELAMRAGGTATAAAVRANGKAVTELRRRGAAAARGALERARHLPPVTAFGRRARTGPRHGIGL